MDGTTPRRVRRFHRRRRRAAEVVARRSECVTNSGDREQSRRAPRPGGRRHRHRLRRTRRSGRRCGARRRDRHRWGRDVPSALPRGGRSLRRVLVPLLRGRRSLAPGRASRMEVSLRTVGGGLARRGCQHGDSGTRHAGCTLGHSWQVWPRGRGSCCVVCAVRRNGQASSGSIASGSMPWRSIASRTSSADARPSSSRALSTATTTWPASTSK